MKKGFMPTPKSERKIKNLSLELGRKAKEFKNTLRNPIFVAKMLEEKSNEISTLEVDTSEVDDVE